MYNSPVLEANGLVTTLKMLQNTLRNKDSDFRATENQMYENEWSPVFWKFQVNL